MLKSIITYLLLFLGLGIEVHSQNHETKMSYEQLSYWYYENENNSLTAKKYAEKYLNKAKLEKKTDQILNGYYFMLLITKAKQRISYCDSIINFSDSLEINNMFYPYLAHIEKGSELYKRREFKSSLNSYLNAEKVIKNHLDFEGKNFTVKYQIGLLKNRIGHFEESLDIFKILNKKFENIKKPKFNDSLNKLAIDFALSDNYIKQNYLDSSSSINIKAIDYSKKLKNLYYVPYFKLNQAIVENKKTNYQTSLDSLEKVIPFLIANKDLPNLSESYYYTGINLIKLNKKHKAIENLIKVDSIFEIIGDLHPSIRDTYKILITNYKKEKNEDLHLKYLNQLLKVDSTINSNYQYLSKNIYKEYDNPKLLEDKETLIKKLKNKEASISKKNIIFLITSIIFIITLISALFTRQKQKRKYKELIEKLENPQIQKRGVNKEKNENNISKDIVDNVLKKIEDFEKNKDYLNSSITLNSLSKKINTNSSYLSRIINEVKEDKFSDYLNNLRVSYATNRLKNDKNFRKYSIKAIADESGFGSPETFSKKFYNTHKIYPSYFIKKLESS